MRERWASLLLNAANPKSNVTVRPAYIEILKQLSPQDAKVLVKVCLAPRKTDDNFIPYLDAIALYDGNTVDPQPFSDDAIAVQNLARLNLLWLERKPNSKEYQVAMTPIGHALLFACGAFDEEFARSKAATPTD